ncbi:helix-turn-helix domain-containing protein [Paenibacillus thiaminolyticus]|uniref:Helix-turn-helix domain-containing protein n=1 Tax=Paenibacillus thiaminolyticus TaxID=49283 RepID=A0AAP9DSM3_PANTH|nr:helix-turn-helix transcriptional regulator [Paenibacillus thiaminolyticus]MCY9538502.1 helix-turn-helix domain-containing protein [Paenibacillus thiaminolyticus]MCY9601239.1 helix-turn-helix domain-containing protein [Paenibacillus thiaminolyticus]MCY9605833.1 helix-turn-helix domain-containing protein [Paenibacillus thiaminolyticus]MCY9611288.1 helix-turn-helix domain-containing protein [Paenibacillus thiaminolyticus]MCY9617517.1 helix-turn-helix domain-containing protein [Paenibacillus th
MAQILSIGELIQCHRYNRGMTLAQLSELTGIHKGTISKIENGNVKRPEYKTIRPLADSLQIPLETLVELHITVDKRADTLLFVLQDVIQHSGTAELVTKVGRKFLESPSDDSHALVERLYDFAGHVENKEIQFALYQLIVDYSRDHGIMPFLARGLFQVYLIERDDFTRLRAVYESGKHIVQYAQSLTSEDRVTLYYKLGVHALNLCLYQQSIELCLHVLREADANNWYYINALGIIRDSYFYIENYEKSEYYSRLYSQYDYPHIKTYSILMTASLNAKKGNTEVAIEQFTSFLKTCNRDDALLAMNQLMKIYLRENRLEETEQLLSYPVCPLSISTNNPNIILQLGTYYYHRAEYFVAVGDLQKGISDFLESALHFSRVNNTDKEKECINNIVRSHLQQNVGISISTLEKLNKYYELSVAKD